uniref:Uncharacterized protein n=1 Tax=Oryza brachyantha TaxID=4533 RepID=J3NBY4_ORYBR
MSESMAATGRMSSMELEPKTLTLDQLNFAREAALYVLSTKPAEEAIRIFTDGLKPVQLAGAGNVRKGSATTVAADSSSDDDLDIGWVGHSGKAYCRHHGRRSSTAVERDIATAPF